MLFSLTTATTTEVEECNMSSGKPDTTMHAKYVAS